MENGRNFLGGEYTTTKSQEKGTHIRRGIVALFLAVGAGAFFNPYVAAGLGLWGVFEFGMSVDAKGKKQG